MIITFLEGCKIPGQKLPILEIIHLKAFAQRHVEPMESAVFEKFPVLSWLHDFDPIHLIGVTTKKAEKTYACAFQMHFETYVVFLFSNKITLS